MCTAATYKTDGFYFGRNLDYEVSYGEKIIITPRNYSFELRHVDKTYNNHFSMIGVGIIHNDYPLYYDAMNEKGLCIAGLNFVGNAKYEHDLSNDKNNIASFELIPYLLGTCSSVLEVKELLNNMVITDTEFMDGMAPGSLHWLIADRDNCITVEYTKDGMHIYDNYVGVLTNNPPFPIQMFNLNNYQNLSVKQPANNFSKELDLQTYSRGMGGLGLPGDLSSSSRFVKVAFTKCNSKSNNDEASSVSQFFHILGSVEQQKGCCEVKEGDYEYTIYSSCCSVDTLTYYYKTYDNHSINAISMKNENLDSNNLISYDLKLNGDIVYQNGSNWPLNSD